VVDGALSDVGRIAEDCWRQIPLHISHVRVDVFQIMPNHVHGIIKIGDGTVGAIHESPPHRKTHIFERRRMALPMVIGRFKIQSAKRINLVQNTPNTHVWQRNFYDHILRDDLDRFFVEEYIRLNPLLWQLDADNSSVRKLSIEAIRKTLQEKHGLSGFALERLIEHKYEFREWWRRDAFYEA
jgi:putative transposase